MSAKIILIRHGLTEWNLKKKYCGSRDIGLHKEGRRQAERLRKKLKGIRLHKIYSSSAKRAMQTAKIVFREREIVKIPGLKEIDFGCFEGMSHHQIMEKYPRIYRKWLNDPFSVTAPKAENLKSFKKRVVRSIKKIVSRHNNETVAVVSHGGAISMFTIYILKSENDFWRKIPASASVTIVEYSGKKAKIRLLNDTSHLT